VVVAVGAGLPMTCAGELGPTAACLAGGHKATLSRNSPPRLWLAMAALLRRRSSGAQTRHEVDRGSVRVPDV
jgi:hypothetical protein